METLRINGREIEIDIAVELSDYHFDNARWSDDKLIASSPFRDDQAPSFYVNLSGEGAGTWGDSGTDDRGGLVQLIALLRGTEYEEASDYLLEKYGVSGAYNPDEPIRLKRIKTPEPIRKVTELSEDTVTQATSPYLLRRGIGERVQSMFGVGYGENIRGHTALPWHTSQGRLANVKYRSTSGRGFFYAKDATPISRLVYGIDLAEEDCAIVEGEIDAMSWHEAGISAVAVGGANFGSEQAEIVKRSKIKRLYLGGDNDEQGRRLNRLVEKELRGYVELYEVDYGQNKDANDVLRQSGVDALRSIYNDATSVETIRLRGLSG